MAIAATASRDDLFKWLISPFQQAIGIGFSCLPIVLGISYYEKHDYVVTALVVIIAAMTVKIVEGLARMSKAAGRL